MRRSAAERGGEQARGLRWWPPLLIVAVAGAIGGWLWLRPSEEKQGRVIATMTLVGVSAILVALWWLCFSRASLRRRLGGASFAAALAGVAALLFEVRGVSGDLVPIVGWRFGAREDAFRSGANDEPAAGATGTEPEPALQTWFDFPQLLGPKRDGRIDGVALERDWIARPPRVVWRRAVGPAWASFAVSGRDAVTQEQRGEREAVVCYDLLTGEERWVHEHQARYDTTLGGVGPRATPAIVGERVYAMGATGILDALDRKSGASVWERATLVDLERDLNPWGTSTSPLVLGPRVVVTPGLSGASMAAYDAASGARAWAGGSDRSGYSSPVLATLAGVPQLLAFGRSSLTAHDPVDGRVLWTTPWSDRNPNVAQPVVVADDALVVSSGYGVGAARYRVTRRADGGFDVSEVWKSRALKAKFANFVAREGFLFGLDDGVLACIDAETGERRWKGGRYGHGQLLLVEDLLLVLAEPGAVVLVEATPEAHRELASFEVFTDKTWNPPALAAPYLLVRNDVEAACLELPLASGARPAR